MRHNRYALTIQPDCAAFEFESVGPNGSIKKAVRYSKIDEQQTYNLSFGDLDPVTGELNDLVVSNNRDSSKVLATVAATLYFFIDQYPEAILFATGSTAARTRLYRMGIAANWADIERDFVVFGLLTDEWQPFRPNVNYEAFLVRRILTVFP